MKKQLLLLVITFFALVSCKKSNTEVHNFLTKNVTDVEILVNYHDSLVQKMLEEGLYDSIPSLTRETIALLGQRLTAIHSLEVPDIAQNYKSAAGLYIEALLGVVKAEGFYSNMNDTINELQAITLDNLNAEAIKAAEIQHAKYIEYQKAFSKANGSK